MKDLGEVGHPQSRGSLQPDRLGIYHKRNRRRIGTRRCDRCARSDRSYRYQYNRRCIVGRSSSHGTRVYSITGTRRIPRSIYEAEQAYLSSYQEIYDPIATGTAFYFPLESASGGMVVANVGHTPPMICNGAMSGLIVTVSIVWIST